MEKEQALQALLDQVVRQGDFIGVSALYLRDGKQLAYAQAGMADRERGIPFARDTICRVFSMSKPITAFAVMKLWEDGKLDLDEQKLKQTSIVYDRDGNEVNTFAGENNRIWRSSGMPSIRT